ncbi:MAG: cytochrome c3 family protein [Coriobacteriales bacterium]|jgi:flagellar basal body-associated protein FliL|nr:cytochrome c3 family protein [Coriobacteriales bacterium]
MVDEPTNECSTDEKDVSDTSATIADDEKEATPKKKKGKGKIILLTVVIVIVVLFGGGGIAYAATHEDPHFCNFLCHVPMDPYVESYDNNVSINAKEAEATGLEGAPLSVTVHKESDQDINCLKCHEPKIDEQIAEGLKWVTGDYSVPLEGIKLVASETPKEGDTSGITFCLRPGCHTDASGADITTYDQLKKSTDDLPRNVHEGEHGYKDCRLCHNTHEQSVLLCSQCHNDLKLPEGWVKTKAK